MHYLYPKQKGCACWQAIILVVFVRTLYTQDLAVHGRYNVSQKKRRQLTLYTSANVDRFSIFLLPDFQENSARDYYRVFHLTLTVMLRYLANFKNL